MTETRNGKPGVPFGGASGSPPDDGLETLVRPGGSGSVTEESLDSAVSVPDADAPVVREGAVLAGRYLVLRLLGAGGMGEVYEVEDRELGEHVALKTVRPDVAADPLSAERFRREVQLTRKVTHPNVCRVLEFGVLRESGSVGPGRPTLFLTMELLNGETLSRRIERLGPLPLATTRSILEQVVAGLAAAHEAGVVHRDLKSPNIFLVEGSAGTRAVITDFGLARSTLQETGDAGGLTATGMVVGSPAYMAPEQITGQEIGPATDVYALGVVLFEMLTGERPFRGETPLAVAVRRLQEDAPLVRELRADVPAEWESCVRRCLARRPEDRFGSVPEVVRHLGSATPSLAETAATTVMGRARGRRFRLPRAAWMAAGVGLLVAGAITVPALLRSRAAPGTQAPVAASGPAATPARRTVAVLGFRNTGPAELGWLDDAFSEMLRTELGASGTLRVIPGERVLRFRADLGTGPLATLDDLVLERLVRALGADVVVLGTFLALPGTSDKRVRFDLQVRDAGTKETLASINVTGTETRLFEMVSEAGSGVRTRLGFEGLSDTDEASLKRVLPASAEGARLYADGLGRLRRFDALGARDALRKAVVADPESALVRTALASAWSVLGYDARAREEAERAVELAAALPSDAREPIEAQLFETVGRWDDAAEKWRLLLERHPDDIEIWLRRSAALTSAGKGQEAESVLQALRRAAPASANDLRVALEETQAAKQQARFGRQLELASGLVGRARANGEQLLEAQGQLLEADALVQAERFEDALLPAKDARDAFARLGNQAGAAHAENVFGIALASADRNDEALAAFRGALATFEEIGHRKGIANQLTNVGNVLASHGDVAGAKRSFRAAMETCQEIADLSCRARSLNNLATLQQGEGAYDAARRSYEEAAGIYRQIGAQGFEARTLANLGEVLAKARKWADSEASHRRSVLLFQALRQESEASAALLGQALSALGAGDRRRARSLLQEAEEAAGPAPDPELAASFAEGRKKIQAEGG